MACLLPRFKPPSSSSALSRPSPQSLHPAAKAKDSVCFRVSQCVLSLKTAVIDFEQIPMLKAHSTSLSTSAMAPLTYVEAVGPPTKTSIEANLASETLIISEEAVIVAAAVEAVTLARAAVELLEDAAQRIRGTASAEAEKSEYSPYEADIKWLEWVSLTETEWTGMTNHSAATETKPIEENTTLDQYMHTDISSSTYHEPEIHKTQHSENIFVRSGRQKERRTRRARAAEKAATRVISLEYGSSRKEKPSTSRVIDFSDPLRYLRGSMSTPILTAAEEIVLSEGIQDLLKLEKLQQYLAERNGCQPTFAQWAAAAGIDQKALRKRLNHGTHCKGKMIKSNIRLVISVAKGYQSIGMNIQDLVQEGCRGLVKATEKFDASKGFKFSTYAHWWIKHAVQKSVSEHSSTIRLPLHMAMARYRVKEATKQLIREKGRHPDNEEIAEATGLSMKKIAAVLLTLKGIDGTIDPMEFMADPNAETAEDIFIKRSTMADLKMVLDTVSPREKQVLRWRYGLEDGRMRSLQEVGDLMGVSRERIRQMESSAFRKMKRNSSSRTENLRHYLISSHFRSLVS